MAKQKGNVVTYGLSGKIGDLLVFRQQDGKTIVSKIPAHSGTVSEKQAAHRRRFQQAVIYAKAATVSPETEELYRVAAGKGISPFNVAVADFFNAPDIHHIDLSEYTGKAGGRIRITVDDDVAVKSVKVEIRNADGSPVEAGDAARGAGGLWTYTAVQDNDNLDGDKITVTVSDVPGNVMQEEREL
ncbi:MAG: hypothetical protein LBJ01_09470 [Tannerella sp.]|jgi:hypothetical protein|nr:hypothetical protein [Tannerella sp.]